VIEGKKGGREGGNPPFTRRSGGRGKGEKSLSARSLLFSPLFRRISYFGKGKGNSSFLNLHYLSSRQRYGERRRKRVG